MKKFISAIISFLCVDAAFAGCSLTSHVLSMGSDATYDEYLYPDGGSAEMRQEGANVNAYLCGYDGCAVGEVLRLTGAAIGGNGTNGDKVYKCEMTNGGRENYHWVANDVRSLCFVGNKKFRYDDTLNLYVYGNEFCQEIDEIQQLQSVFNIDNSTVVNNITKNYDVDVTNVYEVTIKRANVRKKLDAEDLKKIKSLINKSENDIRADLKSHGIEIAVLKDDVNRLKILYRNVADIAGQNEGEIQKMANQLDNVKSNQVALQNLVDAVSRAGLNENMLNDVKDLIADAARELNEDVGEINSRLDKLGFNVHQLKKQLIYTNFVANSQFKAAMESDKNLYAAIEQLDKDLKQVGVLLNDRTTAQQAHEMIQEAVNDSVAMLDGSITNVVDNVYRTIIADLNNKISAEVGEIDFRLNMLQADLMLIDSALMWQRVANKIKNAEQDEEMRKLAQRMEEMQGQVNSKMDENQIVNLFKDVLDDVNLNSVQLQTVRAMFEEEARGVGARMDIISDGLSYLDERMGMVEIDVDKIKAQLEQAKKSLDESFAQAMQKDDELKGVITSLGMDLMDVRDRLNDRFTNAQVNQMIEQAVSNAVLKLDGDITGVVDNIYQIMNQELSESVGHIEKRLGKIEGDVLDLQKKSVDLVSRVGVLANLTDEQVKKLQQQVADKTSSSQVVELIVQQTQSLRDDVKIQIADLMAEYAKQFAKMQQVEIENIINVYIEAKIGGVSAELKKAQEQNVARDRINSAMSVLNSFAASAKVSVWKNKEGNFNTARLASDSIAGVVLGTAGGLISNRVIKKNQVKKGMDGIKCTVGSQYVADWGDEFIVGMQ